MYASPELKSKIVKLVKELAAKKGIKLIFNTRIVDCRRIVLNIAACSIDLIQNYKSVQQKELTRFRPGTDDHERVLHNIEHCDYLKQEYTSLHFNAHYLERYFSGESLELLNEIKSIIKVDHYDHSDSMRGYSDCAYGWELSIGGTKKGFATIQAQTEA